MAARDGRTSGAFYTGGPSHAKSCGERRHGAPMYPTAADAPGQSLPTVRPGDVAFRAGVPILRRAGGRWYAWRATLVRCDLCVAMNMGDTASAATDSLFVARARRECGASVGDTHGNSRVYSADTLALERISVTDPETLWSRIVAAGGLRLPPRRPVMNMRDGNAEVEEIRRGASYRAAVFEAFGDATGDADSVAIRL